MTNTDVFKTTISLCIVPTAGCYCFSVILSFTGIIFLTIQFGDFSYPVPHVELEVTIGETN